MSLKVHVTLSTGRARCKLCEEKILKDLPVCKVKGFMVSCYLHLRTQDCSALKESLHFLRDEIRVDSIFKQEGETL